MRKIYTRMIAFIMAVILSVASGGVAALAETVSSQRNTRAVLETNSVPLYAVQSENMGSVFVEEATINGNAEGVQGNVSENTTETSTDPEQIDDAEEKDPDDQKEISTENENVVLGEEGAQEAFEQNGIKYRTNSDNITVTVIGSTDNTVTQLTFPETVNFDGYDYQVTIIASSAFQGYTRLETVNLPETVTEIGYYAFSGCTKLKNISLPGRLESLGSYTFQNCTSLEQIEIPKSLSTIPYYLSNDFSPFYGCTNLKEIRFEEGIERIIGRLFKNCSYITEISLPDTITSIGDSTFSGCTGLITNNIPPGVESIGNYAFSGCTRLETVNLPETVIEIGYYAFSGCTKLKNISLPGRLESLGSYTFQNCTSLEQIEIPKSLSTIPYYLSNDFSPFYGCTNLKEIRFEEGIERIIGRLFKNCSYITEISLPDTITSIGQSAFSGCTGLTKILFPKSVKTFGSNAFQNCSAVWYCSAGSEAVIYAIQNKKDFLLTDSLTADDNLGVDRLRSSYYMSSSNSYITFVANYQFQYDVNRLKNMKAVFYIPSNASLVEDSVTVNGVPSTDYTLKNQILYIPVTQKAATIRFCINPSATGSFSSYAQIMYSLNGYSKSETFGLVLEKTNVLTVLADSNNSNGTIAVNGRTGAGQKVELYIGNELAATVTANKVGEYSANVTIPSPINQTYYTIQAKTTFASGETLTNATEVFYAESLPILEEIVMYYGNDSGTQKIVLSDAATKNKVVTFASGKEYSFTVSFNDNSNIDRVYIVSTRNGNKRYLDAVWDGTNNCYVTDGRFEPGNSSYVPGNITVEYTLKDTSKQVVPGDRIDFTDSEFTEGLTDAMKNSSITTVENTSSRYESRIDFSEEMGKLADAELHMVVETVDKQYGSDISGVMKDYENFFSYFMEGSDNKKYVLNLDYTDANTYCMILNDITSNKMYKYTLQAFEDNHNIKAADFMQTLSDSGTVAGYLSDYFSIQGDYEEMKEQIYRQGFTQEEREEALAKAKQLKRDQEAFMCVTMLITAITMGGGPAMAAPSLAFSLLFGAIKTSSDFFFNMRIANILKGGSGHSLKWAIDPSGYVYAGVTANRLEDVKTTLYFKASLNAKAAIWNASEYSQQNPLYTDANGMYSWDVPEGLWQVKYEKSGYATQYSAWLEVPPPQMNVNINMFPSTNPKVLSVKIYDNYAEVEFDQYMVPSTIRNIKISDSNGADITYTIDYDRNERSYEGIEYAKTYRLYFNNYVADNNKKYTVSVPSSTKNYANMPAEQKQVVVGNSVQPQIIVNESIKIKYNTTVELPIRFVCASGITRYTVTSNSDDIVVIPSGQNMVIDQNGNAKIKIMGKMYGTASIKISIPGSNINKTIKVEVGREEKLGKLPECITLDKSAGGITLNEKITITPTIHTDIAGRTGHWEILEGNSLISRDGNTFTGLKYGTARMKYVLDQDSKIYAICTVTVIKPIEQSENPSVEKPSNPNPPVVVEKNPIEDFVKRMYTVALGREAEKAGLDDWSSQLSEQKIDGAGIANGFINSVEFKNRNLNNSDFLDVLYRTFFDREADAGGKSYWLGKMETGISRTEVLSGFVNSQEFSNLCDSFGIARGTMQANGSSIYRPGVRGYVLRMYTKALNRDGETVGVEDWTNRINTGAMSAETVAKSFFGSEEFLNRKLSNEDYVETLYQTFMDRASDEEGKNYWLNKLSGGMSRDQVLEGFSRSVEFLEIMHRYGL